MDPNSSSYQKPQAAIYYPQIDYVWSYDEIIFGWYGNNSNCVYSYKFAYSTDFNDASWSDWSKVESVEFGNLDEEMYTFGVKARYPEGEEQDIPTTLSFLVDAFPDSSLLIKPCSTSVSLDLGITIEILVKEVENLMAAKINLSFSSNLLEVVQGGIAKGEYLGENGKEVVFLDSVNNAQGKIEIDLGIAEGTLPGVSGSGTLALITFRTKSPGNGYIRFESHDLRSTGNDSIQISYTRDGKVVIE